jgi:hypothetical protein
MERAASVTGFSVVDFKSVAAEKRLPPLPVQEIDDVHPQSVSHQQQVAELHLVAGFHPLDGAAVDARGVREGLLGQVLVQPADANAVPGRPAGCGDPLGLIGWHLSNALPIKIISQQQI